MGLAYTLGRMGDDMVDVDLTNFWNAAEQLRESRAFMEDLRQQILADPALNAQIGAQFGRADIELTNLVDQYQTIYRAIYGELDTGMGVLAAGYLIALIAALMGGLYLYLDHRRSLADKAAEAAQKKAILDKAAAADAAGDKASGDKWRGLFKDLNSQVEKVLSGNWPILAAGLGMVAVVSMGGGRR